MFAATEDDTFLGFPSADAVAPRGLDGVDVAVIGAPCATPYASVGPYCKDAPAAIRAASSSYSGVREHLNFDLGGPIVPEGVNAIDLGDVEWDESDHDKNRAAIRSCCEAVLAAGGVPVVLGGDDSIPIPVIHSVWVGWPTCLICADSGHRWSRRLQALIQ